MSANATALLQAPDAGTAIDTDRLAPLVYDELRRLAGVHLRRERFDHSLQATALAHEAFLRLVDQSRVSWKGRAHFMGVAAQMIRRILVDHARARAAIKRGGGAAILPISCAEPEAPTPTFDILELQEALMDLQTRSERQARVVELKFFAGLENREAAEVLGVSESVVKNDWRFARAWLAVRLGDNGLS